MDINERLCKWVARTAKYRANNNMLPLTKEEINEVYDKLKSEEKPVDENNNINKEQKMKEIYLIEERVIYSEEYKPVGYVTSKAMAERMVLNGKAVRNKSYRFSMVSPVEEETVTVNEPTKQQLEYKIKQIENEAYTKQAELDVLNRRKDVLNCEIRLIETTKNTKEE